MPFLPQPPFRIRSWLRLLALPGAVVVVAIVGLLAFRATGERMVAGRVRRAAAERGLEASWRGLRYDFPLHVALTGLSFTRTGGDTAFTADSLSVTVSPGSMFLLRPRPQHVSLSHARVWLRGSSAADPDTLAPDEPRPPEPDAKAASERIRRSADQLLRLLLARARQQPRLFLRDVTIRTGSDEDAVIRGARFEWLVMRPDRGGARLVARGDLLFEREVPFQLGLNYGRDDRITGGARFQVPATAGRRDEHLTIAVDGHLTQKGAEARLEDPSRVTIGRLPLLVSGKLSRKGPRLSFSLAADGVTQDQVAESLPKVILGPLLDLSVRGSFDYRLGLDLDLSRPDDVQLNADVIPHDLRLDPARTRLRLIGLEEPFVATIYLPRGARPTRDLSPANPHFRTLAAIDSILARAVVTNEDGGFFRHRGFNLDAFREAIAANLRAGAYRRGAGTITMQLARNLYLGHERTLSRKGQEVVLAWVLEHLTGVSKRRLLEIYLNIIEWGPGVHGADEATHYYFGHDAGHVTVDEALFLSTVVPAPRKWRYRFGPDGELRRFARAQMHFIGRAMIAKGWLTADRLPPADSLRVELKGPARDVLFPPPVVPADSARADSTAAWLRVPGTRM